MAVLEAMAILLALTMLALLPCLVVVVLFADAILAVFHRRRRPRTADAADGETTEGAAESGVPPFLVAVVTDPVEPGAVPAEPMTGPRHDADDVPGPADTVIGPPLEQIAADIHRLSYARRTATVGTARFIAATRAYDRRLGHACHALEIDQYLADLTGLDLDLERVRVEGELIAAGFVLEPDIARPA